MLPQIEQLHIIMTELGDCLCDLLNSCPTVEGGGVQAGVAGVTLGGRVTGPVGNEKFDYEVGG
ncbi:MAG: hypothetical protein HGA96_03705 [Desulfobulbaceae bacterium]|nr:hypothetical protein [Desulfobulbaceae bacterium]